MVCKNGYNDYIGEEKCPGHRGKVKNSHLTIMKETEKVLKVFPRIDQDSVIWKIKIRGKWFEMKSEKLLRSDTFKRKWLDNFDELISFAGGSQGKWVDLVNSWAQQAVPSKNDDPIDHEQVAIDTIVEWVQTCEKTEDIGVAWRNPHYIYCNGDAKAYFPSKHISQIIRTEKLTIGWGRLRKLLDPYLLENTEVMRVGDKTCRFWVFDSSIIQEEEDDNTKATKINS